MQKHNDKFHKYYNSGLLSKWKLNKYVSFNHLYYYIYTNIII